MERLELRLVKKLHPPDPLLVVHLAGRRRLQPVLLPYLTVSALLRGGPSRFEDTPAPLPAILPLAPTPEEAQGSPWCHIKTSLVS